MMKLSEVSGQICPGSCCMPRTMMKNATASRHTQFFWETSLCKLQTHLLATLFILLSFCICLCSRLSVALLCCYFLFSICLLGKCSCYIYTLEVRLRIALGGSAKPVYVICTEVVLARTFSRQEVLFSCCWNIWDTIASVADKPGDAEILFSRLEKSSMILIINCGAFWSFSF